jgi:NADPH-dependent 7-cyano-7-deazaguanine reductase QueF
LYPLLEPEELLIKTRYNTRGGIDTTCTIDSNEQKN